MRDSRTAPNQLLRLGFVADGCFKLLVAACLPAAATRIGASSPLAVTASAAVLASAVTEIDFGVRSGAASHTRYLAAYDSGWLATTGIAVLMARKGSPLAGKVWLGYQAIAAVPLALAFSRRLRGQSSR